MRLRLLPGFITDCIECGCDVGDYERGHLSANAAQIAELLDRARYYADADGPDRAPAGLKRSPGGDRRVRESQPIRLMHPAPIGNRHDTRHTSSADRHAGRNTQRSERRRPGRLQPVGREGLVRRAVLGHGDTRRTRSSGPAQVGDPRRSRPDRMGCDPGHGRTDRSPGRAYAPHRQAQGRRPVRQMGSALRERQAALRSA